MEFEKYQDGFKHIRLERRDGILEVRIHTDDGPAIWDALASDDIHGELGEAFYRIGRDPGNRVVILTGTGDEFITDWNRYSGPRDADFVERLNKEARDLLQNLLDIDVPVIGAANGPAFVHAELLALSDIVIASERAAFADRQHLLLGYVPGDGTHVCWDTLLGPNRARHFLLTGREIDAHEAKQLGFVAEVVPHGQALDRARQIARDLLAQPRFRLRYSRVALTQNIKRRMLDDLGYGLMLEITANFLRALE
jgi:enoyl-CoA hydratase/carnithine racemase